jgi:hypothetical protein
MPAPIEDVRNTLRALLDDMEGKQSSVSDYDGNDKVFMLIACCAQLIEISIVAASHNCDDAIKGVEAFTESMKRNVAQEFRNSNGGRLQ